MNIYEDTNPRELKELLHQIYVGDTVLPDFQRDFVWDPNMTMELIISIAENFPAGSLLRIRNTKNLFAYREFEGSPALNGKKPTYLVLDGQQRLTSLYQAFFGVGDSRYYLNIRKLLEGKDFEDCIFHLKYNHKKVANYDDPVYQASELILPLHILKGGLGKFTTWLLDVSRKTGTDHDQLVLQGDLLRVGESWIQSIDDYRFPVVTLSDTTSAEAVCTIFETLNRTGVKLSPFELLTARFWHQNVNLRQLWAEAKEKNPIFSDFEIDPYYVLQIISLVSRTNPSCKRSDVLNMNVQVIHDYWEPVIDGLSEGLKFLRDGCGVLIPNLLPYNTIVIPISAIFTKLQGLKGPQIGASRDKISQWFWCSVFGQRYESAPNSQSAVDTTDVVRWVNGSQAPESVSSFKFDAEILRDTTGRQRAVYRGVLALVLRNKSRDFHTDKVLTPEVIIQQHVDDHHIFPNSYLERRGYPSRLRDCVLNHTLIDRTTNVRINNCPPSVYMKEILSERSSSKLDDLLDSHLLPVYASRFYEQDDYEDFLDWRQEKIWGEISRLTGLA